MQHLIAKASVLIEALPYIQDFAKSVVLVKFGGSAMEDPEITQSVLQDIAFMASAGMRPIVVHGGGKAITAEMKKRQIESHFINGLRYTCEKSISVVDEVMHRDINPSLVKQLAACGANPAPMSGKDILRARKITTRNQETGEPIDLGFVGEVINVDTPQINWVMERGQIPVITPLACDMDGQVYNINGDMAACVIAAMLKVRKLVFLSDVSGVLKDQDDPKSLISTIRIQDIPSLAAEKVISGGMLPKLQSAAQAIAAGVDKVHLIDGRLKHSLLLEIFTDHGIGTQIV
ncbi:MAG: Acetylglutamate kinase [Lentisphaerae bacterium ADurb.Bin082]|nr:MAG: Acetylglutamate kinase [Lentisphaerae bacterium ADurb.Bin082]